MASFASKRRPLALTLLLGCVLAFPASAQPWQPTEAFDLRWEPFPEPLWFPWQPYETWWAEPPRQLPEIPWYLPESRWAPPQTRWLDLAGPQHQIQAAPSARSWNPGEIRLRERERGLLSYLDRGANPYNQYLADQSKQDAVLLGLRAKNAAMTLAKPTPLGLLGIAVSIVGSLTPRGSSAEEFSTAGERMITLLQLGYEDGFAKKAVLSAVAHEAFDTVVSNWASNFVQDKYTTANSLTSRWVDYDMSTWTAGSTTIRNVETFEPGNNRGRIGPVDFFDGRYERRTTLTSAYRTQTHGGLRLSGPDLEALERGRRPLSEFRIEPRGLGLDAGVPPEPKDRGGVDIAVELKEEAGQETGLSEAVIDARPASDVPFWDFPLPEDPSQKKEAEKDEKEKEEHL